MYNTVKELPDIPHLEIAVIHWRGPYKSSDTPYLPNGNGIYIATGRQKYGRKDEIQYIGITERNFSERIDTKHLVNKIKLETREFWLGQIVSPVHFSRRLLEDVEHCLIYFWQPKLNTAKRTLPAKPICFINQWFFPYDYPRTQRPSLIRDLPDVLWHNSGMWRTGKLRKWERIDRI